MDLKDHRGSPAFPLLFEVSALGLWEVLGQCRMEGPNGES